MASGSLRQVALLSIKPRYAIPIMDGRKKVEFRKSRPAQDVSHALVYATDPEQRVLGFFEVSGIVEGTPRNIWAKYGKVGCIEKRLFDEYYAGATKAVAILVGAVKRFKSPVRLSAVDASLKAPQSYRYVSERLFKLVLSKHPRHRS